MCDIKIKREDLKTITVYKVVMRRIEEDVPAYYSWFAGTPLKKGDVVAQTNQIFYTMQQIFRSRALKRYEEGESHYNVNMPGKVSGFERKEDAFILYSELPSNKIAAVVKIVLGGEIMQGTAARVTAAVPYHHITYAGTKIKSITELKIPSIYKES